MDDDQFLVLNSVYLRKLASPQILQECSGLPRAQALAIAVEQAEQGVLIDVGGENFMLTDDGAQIVLAEYRGRYGELRQSAEVEQWYQRFETVNTQFLATLSAWQTGGEDDAQLGRLIRLVERHARALRGMSDTVPRYARYADRLEAALARIDNGENEFVTSPMVDSVHNAWFEFHEDILTLLGRPRDVAEAEAAKDQR